jgi:hypothetical protein
VSNDLGFQNAKRCVAGPSGEVYVLGKTFVVRYEGGAFSQENVNLMGQSAAEWNDLAFTFCTPTDAFLVGGIGTGGTVTSYRYARRDAMGGGWTALAVPNLGSTLSTIVALGPNQYLASGTAGTVSTTPKFLEWNGSAWVGSTNPPPSALSFITDASASSDKEVFLVGTATGGGPIVIRGRR